MKQRKKVMGGGVGGYYKATNQDVIMQFSMYTMIKGAIIEARDF